MKRVKQSSHAETNVKVTLELTRAQQTSLFTPTPLAVGQQRCSYARVKVLSDEFFVMVAILEHVVHALVTHGAVHLSVSEKMKCCTRAFDWTTRREAR